MQQRSQLNIILHMNDHDEIYQKSTEVGNIHGIWDGLLQLPWNSSWFTCKLSVTFIQ